MNNLASLAAEFRGVKDPSALTSAERRLLQAAPSNTIAVCGPTMQRDDPNNDPGSMKPSDRNRRIGSDLIRWLCVNRQAREMIDPAGLQVFGAQIEGELDLADVPVPFRLMFVRCRFWNDLDFSSGSIPELDLRGSWVPNL